MTSTFVVTDTRTDPAAHFSSLGGGRIASGVGSTVGSYVTQQRVGAGGYKAYQLSGRIAAADLAASETTYVYLDPAGATPLGYEESISIISAFAILESDTASAGTIELCADYLYNNTTVTPVLVFSNTFLAGTAGDPATLGSEITFGAGGGPSTSSAQKFNALYAQPRLFFRRQGTVTGAAFAFQINFIVIPSARAD
jgi:hypothetical protein